MGAAESTSSSGGMARSAATGVAGHVIESSTSNYTQKHTGRQRGATENAIRGVVSATGVVGTGACVLADGIECDHHVKMRQIDTERKESSARGSNRLEAEVDAAHAAGLLDGDYATLKAWSRK